MAGKDIEKIATDSGEIDQGTVQHIVEDDTADVPSGGTLDRYINFFSAINFSFILQCSWEAAAVTFQFSLLNGGPASIAYGSIFAGIGTMLVATSLAEMSSMYDVDVLPFYCDRWDAHIDFRDPTVGAQYRWSATFAPKWNRFFGLMQGWTTLFGWICSCTSNPAIASNIIVGLAIFNYPNYVPKRWHATLIMWAIIALPFLANFWFRKVLKIVEAVGAICQVVFFFVSIITLAALAEKSTVHYVFHTLTHDLSGWTNPAAAWGIGLLTVTYPLTGFDGVLHMSDEVKKARTRVPRSMMTSVALNAIMQFLYMITVLFCIGNVDQVSADYLPIIQVYYQATGSKHATNLFVVMLAIIIFISFFNVFASVSRLLWAFSRDNGLPFSKFFAQVNPRFKLPINALVLICCCLCILALINIGSSVAFNAFISLPALALYISYFFPIFFLFIRRLSRNHPTPIPYGPFKLGKFGPFINLGAMCYLIFVIIWMPMPTILPIDNMNFNYSGPIVGAVILMALGDWIISGRKRFHIPVARHRPGYV